MIRRPIIASALRPNEWIVHRAHYGITHVRDGGRVIVGYSITLNHHRSSRRVPNDSSRTRRSRYVSIIFSLEFVDELPELVPLKTGFEFFSVPMYFVLPAVRSMTIHDDDPRDRPRLSDLASTFICVVERASVRHGSLLMTQ